MRGIAITGFVLISVGCQQSNLKYEGKGLDVSRVYQHLSVSSRKFENGTPNIYATASFGLGGASTGTPLALPSDNEFSFSGKTMTIESGMTQYWVNIWDTGANEECLFRWKTGTGDTYENSCLLGEIILSGETPTQISKATGHSFGLSIGPQWATKTMMVQLYQFSQSAGGTSLASKQETAVIGSDGAVSITILPADLTSLALGSTTVIINATESNDKVNGPGAGHLDNTVETSFTVDIID